MLKWYDLFDEHGKVKKWGYISLTNNSYLMIHSIYYNVDDYIIISINGLLDTLDIVKLEDDGFNYRGFNYKIEEVIKWS